MGCISWRGVVVLPPLSTVTKGMDFEAVSRIAKKELEVEGMKKYL